MGDGRSSREALRSLSKRCVTSLDRELMVYVNSGPVYTILTVWDRWRGKALRSMFVRRADWKAIGSHGRMRVMGEFISKVKDAASVGHTDPKLPRDFTERFPALADFMCSGRYPDGTVRERSAITVMASEHDGFKGVLNDRDNARSLWAVAGTLEGLFVSLESLLCDPKAPWKASLPPRNPRGGK